MASEADGAGMRRRAYAVAWWGLAALGAAGVVAVLSHPGVGGGLPVRSPSVFQAHGGWFVLLWPALVTGRWVRTGRWAFGPRF